MASSVNLPKTLVTIAAHRAANRWVGTDTRMAPESRADILPRSLRLQSTRVEQLMNKAPTANSALRLVSPSKLALVSYIAFLATLFIPPDVYSRIMLEPNHMFLDPLAFLFVTCCVASFFVGYGRLRLRLRVPSVRRPSGRAAPSDLHSRSRCPIGSLFRGFARP